MQRIRQLGLLLATFLSLFVLAAMPVAAEQGNDGNDSSSDGGTPPATINARLESLRGEAKAMLTTKRDDHAQRSTEARQQACEARAANINMRADNYAAAAQRHLSVFSGILTKVQNFYTSKNLNVASYASLLATAQAKQADAQTAVDALKALDVKIDCTQSDPAQTVAALKQAVADARTSLQAYRSAIKDVVVALQGASSAQDKTGSNTGGAQ